MAIDRVRTINGVRVPSFMYGTAWKELETKRLVGLALEAGFRAIDTANQRKHYHEAGVGEALAAAFKSGLVKREDLFIQTKFTHIDGQDHRLPYDPDAPVGTQVLQSHEKSLEHLGVTSIDSLVLHGPSLRDGLADEDWEAWRAMEKLAQEGKVKLLGASNVNRGQLELLVKDARVKPVFVQNRCYARTGWDRNVRALCKEQGIVYQGFSLLTANRNELDVPKVHEMVNRTGLNVAQIVFRFSLAVGMLPLTGTKSPAHMRDDLAVFEKELSEKDVKTIETIAKA